MFHGGTIITLDDSNPNAEALAVKGGRIVAVGDYEELQKNIGTHTEVVDLGGHTMLPGFIEAHSHMIVYALAKAVAIDISGYPLGQNYATIEKKMKEAIANTATDGWCLFAGWDVELVEDLPVLSADYLDINFSNTINIVVVSQSGHAAWVNSKALHTAKINKDTPNPEGGRYGRTPDGDLTGELFDAGAMFPMIEHVRPLPGVIKVLEEIKQTLKVYARAGLTTATEMVLSIPNKSHSHSCCFSPLMTFLGKEMFSVLQKILEEIHIPVRLACYVSADSDGLENELKPFKNGERLWIAGVKFYADGSPHCGTAALSEQGNPYLHNEMTKKLGFPQHNPNYGMLERKTQELLKQVKPYHDAEYQVAIHAHGDRAIDQVLEVYKNLPLKEGNDRRHRIEHMGFAKEAQLNECARLNIAPSMFVSQLHLYGEVFSNFTLGKEHTENWAPVDFAYKHGCKVSLHQDNPTFPGPPQPLVSIKTAVTRTYNDTAKVYGPSHCISVHEAIQAYTTGPAWQLFRENELGKLKEGFRADLIILSANPYLVDPMKLDTITVCETYTHSASVG